MLSQTLCCSETQSPRRKHFMYEQETLDFPLSRRILTSPCPAPCVCLRWWRCRSRSTRWCVSASLGGPAPTSQSMSNTSTSTLTHPGSPTLAWVCHMSQWNKWYKDFRQVTKNTPWSEYQSTVCPLNVSLYLNVLASLSFFHNVPTDGPTLDEHINLPSIIMFVSACAFCVCSYRETLPRRSPSEPVEQ